jgi:hypothetical protein
MLAGFVAITNVAWRRLDRGRSDYVMAA